MFENYEEMWGKFLRGEITGFEWFEYSEKCLEQILAQNAEALERLKQGE